MADDKKINKNKLSSRIHRAEQCLLVGNVATLIDSNATKKTKGDSDTLYKCLNKHHISLGTDEDILEEVIGTVFVGSDMQTFMDLDEEEISYLAPKIRLFRVFDGEQVVKKLKQEIKKENRYLTKKAKASGTGFYSRKERNKLLAKSDKLQKRLKKAETKQEILEFKFENFQDNANIEAIITGTRDRVQEAGIVSCNWNLMGKNPVEAERLVDVQIKFFFSSIETLLSNGAPGTNAPPYIDLIPDFNREVDTSYNIVLAVGYEVPDKNFKTIVRNEERYKKITRAIERSNKILNLKFTSQDIEFDQTGMIYMTIRYVGYFEERMSKILLYNDLGPSVYREVQKEFVKENDRKLYIQKLKSTGDKIYKAYNKLTPPKPSNVDTVTGYNAQTKYDNHQQKLRMMRKTLDADSLKKLASKITTLQLINQQLIEGKEVFIQRLAGDEKKKRTSIRQIEVKAEELAHIVGLTNLKQFFSKEDIKKLVVSDSYKSYLSAAFQKGLAKASGKDIAISPIEAPAATTQAIIKNISEFSKNVKVGNVNLRKKELKKQINNQISNITISKSLEKDQKYKIQYTTLGDIYDAIIDACSDSKIMIARQSEIIAFKKYSRVIFGNVKILSFDRSGATKVVTISLNDLPVSMKFFNAWFLRNLIDTGDSKISLLRLFNNFVSQLIQASLGSSCFANQEADFKSFPRTSLRTSTHTLDSTFDPISFTKGDISVEKYSFLRKNPSELKPIIRNFDKLRDQYQTTDNVFNYLFISARNSYLGDRQSNVIRDTKAGIFHLFLGRDNGLVKTINFSKADQKYLEEVNLTKANLNTKLELFRRIYNIQVELFGNSAFVPGQMVYVNADSISKNSISKNSISKNSSTALSLGLGGYYVITEVSNSFEGGAYNTSFKAIWVGFGTGSRVKFDSPPIAGAAGRLKKFADLDSIEQQVNDILKGNYKTRKEAYTDVKLSDGNRSAKLIAKTRQVPDKEATRQFLMQKFRDAFKDMFNK